MLTLVSGIWGVGPIGNGPITDTNSCEELHYNARKIITDCDWKMAELGRFWLKMLTLFVNKFVSSLRSLR